MHKVIYWKGNPKNHRVFYFEHYKKLGEIHTFTIGTTDQECLYVADYQLIKILWDNSIIKRNKQ